MPIKCDYKFADNVFCISAPRGLDILPGRMLRKIIQNLDSEYEICEFSFVKGRRAAEEKEDVIADVYLKSGTGSYLFGSQPIVVFQKIHPSLMDPHFIQLTDDEIMNFKGRLTNLGLDEEYNTNDYTVAMPNDYFIVITKNVKKLAKVLEHLRLESFEHFRDTINRISIASITIYDEADMFIMYNEKTFPTIFTEGLEDCLLPPEEVDSLDF